MKTQRVATTLKFLCCSALTLVSAYVHAQLLEGSTLTSTSLADALKNVPRGSVIVASEQHGFKPHHENQVRILTELAELGHNVSLGMEFLERPDQSSLNSYLRGELPEDVFLKSVGWGSIPFSLYRRQVLFPVSHRGWTYALNAPRSLTGKIARVGLAGLSETERAQLPADFSLGNAGYLERFTNVMKEHVPPEAISRYFEAQSTWDEFMSQSACEIQRNSPDTTLVIIVGDFHAMYGGGLPDRLTARGCKAVTVFSQVARKGQSEDELLAEISPHPHWGKRGDFVWIESE